MFSILKIRKNQGYQTIPNIKKANVQKPFRGFPSISESDCGDCTECLTVCPTEAISLDPLSIDMGKCIFCGDCERECPKKAIMFTSSHKTAADSRERLIVKNGMTAEAYSPAAITTRKEISRLFGGSLKIRQVCAAGCNGCEWELSACGNVNFDMGRFGIDIVASPRHADCILITGPVSGNMADALEDAARSVPDPKIVILAGSCAISGGVFAESPALKRDLLEHHKIDLYIPGCPVHPLTVINGILELLGK